MTSTASALLEFFLIGLATPLTATCVLPLYPSFLAYVASTGESDRGPPVAVLGVLVVAGVIAFMAVVGLLWTVVFGGGVAGAVERVSPAAFGALAVVGVMLLFAPNGFARLPTIEPPHSRYPTASAFGYGFFFGAIVIPCNPGLIALFFSRSTVAFPAFDSQLEVLAGFIAFGLGIGAPLLAFALLSQPYSRRVTRTLARHRRTINRLVGVVILAVSLYYLLFVFHVVPGTEGLAPPLEMTTS
ncbi:cytochrome c biogenesis protein CcdA [Natronolimnohabitans sp. A-GB9]|uniref:cytochrome c biogenesis protein CcdA n=1 Tax=Natronolimnohabitans sp. A-GB9 TaxID=3069757 RepID=UPI0027B63DD2|nr:cytochrome c biogenesis protein CcdA [Natronolimnohabitans sp. A-GB9]MDQ2051439.1 cytochrome c biogenesis protein CcdA [Natronolimnohabitans sp. A-GB9]